MGGVRGADGPGRKIAMLSLVLAESALELVPGGVARHPSVVSHAGRLDRAPEDILLDSSWHFAAMKGMRDGFRRGRPDIVHTSLLAITSTPLYLRGEISVYVHAIDDVVIRLGAGTRMPKSYHRFAGVVEKLYREGSVGCGEKTLLEMDRMPFGDLMDEIGPSRVLGLSVIGTGSTCRRVASEARSDSCIVVGGFPKGHFSKRTEKAMDELYSIHRDPLDAHVAVARVAYECEKIIFI